MPRSGYVSIAVKEDVARLLTSIRARLKQIKQLVSKDVGKYIDDTISDILRKALAYYAAIEFDYVRLIDPENAREIAEKIRAASVIAEYELSSIEELIVKLAREESEMKEVLPSE